MPAESHDGAVTYGSLVLACDDGAKCQVDPLSNLFRGLGYLVHPASLHESAHHEQGSVFEWNRNEGPRILVTHTEHPRFAEAE